MSKTPNFFQLKIFIISYVTNATNHVNEKTRTSCLTTNDIYFCYINIVLDWILRFSNTTCHQFIIDKITIKLFNYLIYFSCYVMCIMHRQPNSQYIFFLEKQCTTMDLLTVWRHYAEGANDLMQRCQSPFTSVSGF